MNSSLIPTAKLPIPFLSVLIGAAILFFGRKLFWLFVAAVGFAIGLEITPHLMREPPVWLALVVALFLGLVGAVIALVLQKLAIAVVGFLVGGRLALAIVAAFVVEHSQYFGITFLIGGIVGALLLLALFDWALIIFSSMQGAHLILSAIELPSAGATLLFVGLAVFGIIVQASMMRRAPIQRR
jgi:hypothetical protein